MAIHICFSFFKIYQQKQLELLTEFQRARASLNVQMQQIDCLQLLQQIQQQQQQQTTSQAVNPVANAAVNVPENVVETDSQQMSPSPRGDSHTGRARRF